MGGGRQTLVAGVNTSVADPIDKWACQSKDGRNLIEDWKTGKSGRAYKLVQNTGELKRVKGNDVDYLLGIFANGDLKYDHERDTSDYGMPSLKDMTLKALEVLKSKDKGFLLIVEGGLIEQAQHRGAARKTLSEVLAFNEAVAITLKTMKESMEETLIIVTADHSPSLTFNSHTDLSSNVLGIAATSSADGNPYTSLTHGTSYESFEVDDSGKHVDPSRLDAMSWDYRQQAVNRDENTHGGSDVAIHADGAMSYLFHGVHEQTYVAHVISYALRIGRFRDSTITESLADLMPL